MPGIDNFYVANSSKILTTEDYHNMMETPQRQRINVRTGHTFGPILSDWAKIKGYNDYVGTLEINDQGMKEYLFNLKKEYYHNKRNIENLDGTGHNTYDLREKANSIQKIHDKIAPYVEHVIEYKQNHEQLVQRSFELEQTITNLENMQKPYQDTIQRMQEQDISKIKNIIYDFLPLREENYTLQQRINDLEAQKFSLELKNKRLLHTSNELNQQLTNTDSSIRNFKRSKPTPSVDADFSQQLNELRASLQNLTERLNAQEANIHNRSNINSEAITSTNNCTIN